MPSKKFYRYSVADMLFDIYADDRFSAARHRDFIVGCEGSGHPGPERGIRVECGIDCMEDLAADDRQMHGIRYGMSGDIFEIVMYGADGKKAHVVRFDESFRSFRIVSSYPQALPFEGSAGEVLFRTAILKNGGIVVHSAGIVCNGSGIIFSAPSGTGKSTQAGMWKIAKNAVVLNGDRAALRFRDNMLRVYGTPWAGSSPESKNGNAPLKAIIVLEQYDRNELIPLSMPEAVRYLAPRCYLPHGQPRLLDLAISNLDRILRSVPVYLLKNKRGFEAVELVANRLSL